MVWLIIAIIIAALFAFVVFFGAPYVPSQKKYVRNAFESLYKIGKKDVLVDVGSGDGVVLRLAAERGARAIGYEINPVLVVISWLASLGNKRVTTQLANFWRVSLPKEVTIIYAFSVSRDIVRLEKKLQSEATRLHKSFKFLVFGNEIKGRKADDSFEAYHLYTFHPLQAEKAQV